MSELFSKNNLFKIGLISISIILWVYFYLASGFSLNQLITLNLGPIFTSFFSINFLMFILLFPLTSSLIIAFSINSNISENVILSIISMLFGFLISFLVFPLSFVFILFFVLYIIAHIFIMYLSYNKFGESDKFTSISNFSLSKVSLFFTIIIFIICIIIIMPSQNEYAIKSEAGLVNLIVGNDFSKFLDASYNIGNASTLSSINYITSSDEYNSLRYVNDVYVKEYLSYMSDIEKNILSANDSKDFKKIYANLDDVSIKTSLLEAIDSMPFMDLVKNNFAIVFAILFASFINLLFIILFSSVGLLYCFIFYKLFYKNL
ncbi:MAG: hypothetical protein PHR26_01935 [Candidatus ainarchaeum sp.]|nr:hypothetical protein [Candidatus ainarchaeum sp.]MDD3975623.1 hypothetical protein [Candidatus ainarchaeum sp.]